MKRILALMAVTLMMTGCSEIEFGSHLFKRATTDDSYAGSTLNTSMPQGTFKVGKPYSIAGKVYHPQERYDYVETGIASWYGPGFHGKKTASGERYDKFELTAAHRTLQMPSLVRVTNLSNGRSVVVRINDRGPFSKGRIIDVSQRAAELLGMIGTGTAKVKVEMLAEESRAIANAARRGQNVKGVEVAMNSHGRLPDAMQSRTPVQQVMSDVPTGNLEPEEVVLAQSARADNIKGHYHEGHFYPDSVVTQEAVTSTGIYVQAGAFGVQENAVKLSEKLSAIAPAKVEPVNYSGRTLYKVRLGPLSNVREADNVLGRVLANGQSDAIIVVQ